MAQTSVRQPVCMSNEMKDIVRVELLIEKLRGRKMTAENGKVECRFSSFGFVMDASVKSGDSKTQWHYKVKKLPREIITEKSSWKIEPGRVVLLLRKKENVSWVPFFGRGLEQASSDSSGSDEETSKKVTNSDEETGKKVAA